LNLRKWMRLFGMTIVIGALAAMVAGAALKASDPGYRDGGWTFNLLMMALGGLTFGAFAHMGFFAYLTLNYIARSIFKRPYLWVALQGFITVFVLAEIAYWTSMGNFPKSAFWAVPLALLLVSVLVSWKKASETSSGAWIPSLFYLIAVTAIEAIPGFQEGRLTSLVFMLAPLFVCNAYQILMLHRILDSKTKLVPEAHTGKPV
jgi:KinB signaling pathway activation protein